MRAILKTPWKRQPPQGTRIDRGNSLGARAIFAYNAADGLNIIGSTPPTVFGAPTFGATIAGASLDILTSGAIGIYVTPLTDTQKPTEATVFWSGVIEAGSTANVPMLAGGYYNAAGTTPYVTCGILRPATSTSITFYWNRGGTVTSVEVANAIVYGEYATFALSVRNGEALGYKNGKLIMSSALATTILYSATSGFQVGDWQSVSTLASKTVCAGYLRGGSSEAELASLTQNPWQIFAPLRRILYAPAVASGGAGDGSGTAVATGAGVGASLFSGAGAGTGVATGTAVAVVYGRGTAVATGSGVGASLFTGAGTGIGVATGAGVGASLFAGAGTGIGVATGTAVGTSTGGASSGAGYAVSTGSAVGASLFTGVGSGTSVATGAGATGAVAAFSQDVAFRKYYMRKGKKLLMFDSVTEAEAYTQAEALAEEAIAKAQKTSRLARKRLRTRIVAGTLPAQTIDTDWLAEMMMRFAINLDLPALLVQEDYNRVAEIYAIAKAMQDEEEDIEMLLLMG